MNRERMMVLQKELSAEEEMYEFLVRIRHLDNGVGREFTLGDVLEKTIKDMARIQSEIEEAING